MFGIGHERSRRQGRDCWEILMFLRLLKRGYHRGTGGRGHGIGNGGGRGPMMRQEPSRKIRGFQGLLVEIRGIEKSGCLVYLGRG